MPEQPGGEAMRVGLFKGRGGRAGWRYAGRVALVTGASSGIGEQFARELASRGMALVLSALPADAERLAALAAELGSRHGVRVEIVPIDLAEPGAAQTLQEKADALGMEPDLLVNNAGMGMLGAVAQLPIDRQLTMLRLNVEAVAALTGLYLPRMTARRDGAIVNVASTAAFDPLPYMAGYAASKAFVLRFSEALWAEASRTGVRVVAVCPGPVADTHFGAGNPDVSEGTQRFQPSIPRVEVVNGALDALDRNRPVSVHRARGFRIVYPVTRFLGAIFPRHWHLRITERLVRWHFRLG